MSHPDANAGANVALVMKVVLDDVEPVIWRRVSVPMHFTLAQLHDVFQVAMGWRNLHLHAFIVDGVSYTSLDDDLDEDDVDEGDVRLDAVLHAGQRFTYHYDFGDDWLHVVEVEFAVSDATLSRHATCLDGQRACPPEDCGGPSGYEEFLTILKDPGDPEHREIIARLSATFDAAAFNRELVNTRLGEMG